MHGFSIYLGQPIDKPYIKRMITSGYSTIFTSVQIPEENESTKYRYLGELLDYLSNEQLTYMIDINPLLLDHNFYQFLHQYETAEFMIRIDHSTSLNVVNDIISNGFKCCINASIISEQLLQQLYHELKDFTYLCYCHNYYPRPDTGLEPQFVASQNNLILKYNAQADIFGFITGSTLRGPLYKGLPTIESTRYQHPIQSAQLLKDNLVEHVMIGDPLIDSHTAQQLITFLHHRHFNLNIELLDDQVSSILFKPHTVRADNPAHVIRSQEARLYCDTEIQPFSTNGRNFGAITVDNKLNGRYQGELQIIKNDLPPHDHINVVGEVKKNDLPLIQCMRPNDTFEFTYKNKEL
ncbi:MAG: MupG family TIM beta-alpha barrel fold protein [Staphylococcus equorum]|nr:MupG family TIM beta-alpha barrel fold protein [Staphylococcus equorum]